MVSITPFKFSYFQQVLDMHETQKSPAGRIITYKTLPKIGFIAHNGKIPVAAGFLRRVEPCYAQIDTLVTNAFAGSINRHEGIRLVVDNLLLEAKRLKLKGVICHTRDKGTLERAKSLGFHVVDETIIALPL